MRVQVKPIKAKVMAELIKDADLLVVEMEANYQSFSKGTKEAKKRIRAASNDLSRTAKEIRRVLKSIAFD